MDQHAEAIKCEKCGFAMNLEVARKIAASSSESFAGRLVASNHICDCEDPSLDDLFLCASIPHRSAAWHPAQILYDRLQIETPKDESGFIVIDLPRLRAAIDAVEGAQHQNQASVQE